MLFVSMSIIFDRNKLIESFDQTTGIIVTDTGATPIAGALVRLENGGQTAITDSTMAF